MSDICYLAVVVIFFAVSGSFTRGCDRMLED